MNLKNISIILAFLSLNVISSPINDVITEGEVTAVEISNAEVSADESVTVNVDVDSVVEDEDSEFSELETPAVPSGPVNNNNEEDDEKLPCNTFYECADWIEDNLDTINLFIEPKMSKEIIDYIRYQYQDGKPIEILQQKYDAINYGIKVDVDGHQMSVNIKGEDNEKTIVVLPGLGILSPVIFYKSITDILANDYRVVTVEPFGYGLSDLVKKERTAENMATEIRTCLQNLGINEYYLMGHSIGGIYSLMIDHMFPGEVLGFIGLDNTPSNYNIPATDYPDFFITLANILDKYHTCELFPAEIKNQLTSLEYELPYQNYTEKEIEDLDVIYSYKSNNRNILSENDLSYENVQATNGIYFQCPILMFIADDTINQIKQGLGMDWEQLHKDMITDPTTSKLIQLEGVHGFIHTQNKDEIAKTVKEWIN